MLIAKTKKEKEKEATSKKNKGFLISSLKNSRKSVDLAEESKKQNGRDFNLKYFYKAGSFLQARSSPKQSSSEGKWNNEDLKQKKELQLEPPSFLLKHRSSLGSSFAPATETLYGPARSANKIKFNMLQNQIPQVNVMKSEVVKKQLEFISVGTWQNKKNGSQQSNKHPSSAFFSPFQFKPLFKEEDLVEGEEAGNSIGEMASVCIKERLNRGSHQSKSKRSISPHNGLLKERKASCIEEQVPKRPESSIGSFPQKNTMSLIDLKSTSNLRPNLHVNTQGISRFQRNQSQTPGLHKMNSMPLNMAQSHNRLKGSQSPTRPNMPRSPTRASRPTSPGKGTRPQSPRKEDKGPVLFKHKSGKEEVVIKRSDYLIAKNNAKSRYERWLKKPIAECPKDREKLQQFFYNEWVNLIIAEKRGTDYGYPELRPGVIQKAMKESARKELIRENYYKFGIKPNAVPSQMGKNETKPQLKEITKSPVASQRPEVGSFAEFYIREDEVDDTEGPENNYEGLEESPTILQKGVNAEKRAEGELLVRNKTIRFADYEMLERNLKNGENDEAKMKRLEDALKKEEREEIIKMKNPFGSNKSKFMKQTQTINEAERKKKDSMPKRERIFNALKEFLRNLTECGIDLIDVVPVSLLVFIHKSSICRTKYFLKGPSMQGGLTSSLKVSRGTK